MPTKRLPCVKGAVALATEGLFDCIIYMFANSPKILVYLIVWYSDYF